MFFAAGTLDKFWVYTDAPFYALSMGVHLMDLIDYGTCCRVTELVAWPKVSASSIAAATFIKP